jgi:hypothetical protein
MKVVAGVALTLNLGKDIYLVRRLDSLSKTAFLTREHDPWLRGGKRVRDLSLIAKGAPPHANVSEDVSMSRVGECMGHGGVALPGQMPRFLDLG